MPISILVFIMIVTELASIALLFLLVVECFYLKKNVDDDNNLDGSGMLINGSLVSIVIGVLGLFRVFLLVVVICLGVYPWLLDFEFGSVDGFGVSFIVFVAGLITGFLYLAASKNARAFWLGTDQIRCNLPIISCGSLLFLSSLFKKNPRLAMLGFWADEKLQKLRCSVKNYDWGRNGFDSKVYRLCRALWFNFKQTCKISFMEFYVWSFFG